MQTNQNENDVKAINKSSIDDKADTKQNVFHLKLDSNNNCLSENKNEQARKITTQKKLLKSFKKIGKCLNHSNCKEISSCKFDKVCLILISNFNNNKENPHIGSLNDGYLFGLYHYRLGFNVFYLYGTNRKELNDYIQQFIANTKENLTIFHSGSNQNEIKFNPFERTGNCKIVLVSDCKKDKSLFDIENITKTNAKNQSDILSFHVDEITHGIFVYYYCRIIYNDPNISDKRVIEKLNSSLSRFKESFVWIATYKVDSINPIYKNCVRHACELFDGLHHDNSDDDYEYDE